MNKLLCPSDKTRSALRGLYVITDSTLMESGELVGRVALAIQGGASMVQYRYKGKDGMRYGGEVRALCALCRSYGIPFIVNDDVALAQASGAGGVHLGRDDPTPAQARRILGLDAIIGVSCYNSMELALQAEAAGADYVAFGRFFPSRTKPEAVKADLALLRQARTRLSIPIAAIGGITPERGAALIEAGADLVAVVHGVFGEPDTFEAARRYARLFE